MFWTRLLKLQQSWMKVLPTRIRNTFKKNPKKFIEKTFFFQKQIPPSKFYSRNVECSYDNSAEMLPAETQFRSLNFRKFKHKILPENMFFEMFLWIRWRHLWQSKADEIFWESLKMFRSEPEFIFWFFFPKNQFHLNTLVRTIRQHLRQPCWSFFCCRIFFFARSPKKHNFEKFPESFPKFPLLTYKRSPPEVFRGKSKTISLKFRK